MKNNEIGFVIILLMVTVVMTTFSLSYFRYNIEMKDKQIEQLIEEQNRKMELFEQQITYQIETLQESVFDLEERLDEAELRLDDHNKDLTKSKDL